MMKKIAKLLLVGSGLYAGSIGVGMNLDHGLDAYDVSRGGYTRSETRGIIREGTNPVEYLIGTPSRELVLALRTR
jgi:hypothetical protein